MPILILLLCLISFNVFSEELPKYDCKRINEPITIDGDLSELAWQNAKSIDLRKTADGTPPDQKTIAKMIWDDQFLYVGFVCEDRDIWTTIDQHDGDLYNEEVVEIFIDPNGDEQTYIELEVNPINALFDAFVINDKKRKRGIKVLRDWDSRKMSHAVSIDGVLKNSHPKNRDLENDDKSWIVEIAIPFSDFFMAKNVPPKIGDQWRINLYRIERGPTEDHYFAWSPTWKIDYHLPKHFGKIQFVTNVKGDRNER